MQLIKTAPTNVEMTDDEYRVAMERKKEESEQF